MSLPVQCPHCKHCFNVSDDMLGQRIKCMKCPGTFDVPSSQVEADAMRGRYPMPPPRVSASPAVPIAPLAPPKPLAVEPVVAEAVPEPEAIPWVLPANAPAASPGPGSRWSGDEAFEPDRPGGSPWKSTAARRGGWFFLVMAIATALLRYGLPAIAPRMSGVTTELPGEPYALDDPRARSRVADGWHGEALPAVNLESRGDGLQYAEVKLPVAANQPGYNSGLLIYEPEGTHAPKSLGCVLTTPSGGLLVAARKPPTSGDEVEWRPYVQAGFAVVAFANDGVVEPEGASRSEANAGADKFFAAQAGLVNARQALEFVLARMPEVDPQRIYVAGNAAAGTLALLWAEHEPRIRGCIAGAPITDVERTVETFKREGVAKLPDDMRAILKNTSPLTHASKFDCPVLLVHTANDDVVPPAESREFVELLQKHGKAVTLIELPPGNRDESMVALGIPRAVEWLKSIDQPGHAAQPSQPEVANSTSSTPASSTPASNVPAPTPSESTKGVDAIATRVREMAWTNWTWSAERLQNRLVAISEGAPRGEAGLRMTGHLAGALADQTLALVPGKPAANSAAPPAFESLAPDTRTKIAALNATLADERKRISEFGGRDAARAELLTQLAACVLPQWLLEGHEPSAEDLAARQEALDRLEALRSAGRGRDYRWEAARAVIWGKPRDVTRLLSAEVLVGDDKSLVEAVRWAPALQRPAALVHWSFGVELNGFPGTGPANLQGPAIEAQPRDHGTQWRLSDQMKSLTGDIGVWIAEGLKNRANSGAFGDWANETRRSSLEQRGIALLDFAPLDVLLKAARAEGSDVLLAIVLTMSRGTSPNNPATSMIVQLYDVQTGQKFWESKPVTRAQLLSALRQGKSLDSDYAEEVLKVIDERVVLHDVPELSADDVQRRLAAIDKREQDDPLKNLIELRFLRAKGKLSDDEAKRRAAEILDEKHTKLIFADDEFQRRKAVETLLPQAG